MAENPSRSAEMELGDFGKCYGSMTVNDLPPGLDHRAGSAERQRNAAGC